MLHAKKLLNFLFLNFHCSYSVLAVSCHKCK